MPVTLQDLQIASEARNCIITKAVSIGFNPVIVPPLLDLLIEELAARPEAIQAKYLTNGPITIDADMRVVHFHGQKIDFKKYEYRMLEYFLRNLGRVISHAEIFLNVWDRSRGHIEESTNIRVAINGIRKKLHPDIIKTKPGDGYYMEVMQAGVVNPPVYEDYRG